MPTRILALGEVLWDVFPDGPRFGGAPANFACSAASLGRWDVRVSIASAVGNDDLGRAAREFLEARGVNTECVTTSDKPTGTVAVTLDAAGVASYRFADNPAWGDLEWTDALAEQIAAADVIYFGTLAQSQEPARTTIRRALAAAKPGCLRVLDLNLRSPFWDAATISESIALATVLKMSYEETSAVAAIDDTQVMGDLIEKSQLTHAAASEGENGSRLAARDGTISHLPGTPVTVVDTVGAGDAFTAALALGLARKWPLDRTHRFAAAAGAFACTVAGGTPVFPDHLTLAEFARP